MPESDPTPQPNGLSESQISEILEKCYPGFAKPILSRQEAEDRASLIHKDMEQVRFPLTLDQAWPVRLPGGSEVWVPSYKLPNNMYGPEADLDGSEKRDAAGPMISCGEFIRLSRACMLGHRLVPERWPKSFASRLRDPDDHLAVIEEILWLGRWHSPEGAENGYRQNPGSNKDIDWRFHFSGQPVNLEVKLRRRDWMAVTDGSAFSRDFPSYFRDVEGKFGPRQNGELNIVGITTFSAPDRGLQNRTAIFLDENPEVDAVVFWILHDPDGKRPEIHGRESELIRHLLKRAVCEEDFVIGPIRHLWRNREERRAMRTDEALDALKKLQDQNWIT